METTILVASFIAMFTLFFILPMFMLLIEAGKEIRENKKQQRKIQEEIKELINRM